MSLTAATGTFGEVLAERASVAPDAPLVIAPEDGSVLTYAGMHEAARRLDALFRERGIAPGEVVGFMLPNGIAAASAFVGTMAAGRIVTPFNLLAQDAHLDYMLGHAAPRLVFAGSRFAGRVREAVARAGTRTEVIETGADVLELPAPTSATLPQPRADVTTMLMYTSGTTGLPKGVLLSHANMLHAGTAVARHHGLGRYDRVLSSLPLYHINGQCIAMVSALVAGASTILPRRFSTQWWNHVEQHCPTWLNLVPTIVAYLLNGSELTPAQREAARGIRFARSASAPLAPDLQRAFEAKFGIPIVEAMGLTESASIAFCNPMDTARRKIGSPGLPLGVEARIVDRDGAVLSDDAVGEIQIRGPSVTVGYYKSPEISASTIRDGWLATGDLGYRDRDGFYFITGRLKELIIKGGENIAPREIDEVLLKHPAVLEAAAVGVADASYGQEILACVVRKPGATPSESELIAHCAKELGRYKTPRFLCFVDELPKGPSGKVQRMKLAEGWKDSRG